MYIAARVKLMAASAVFLLSSVAGVAQPSSYVYIQGDKVTPFYVRINGNMQPRYGKDYCIVPKLPAGRVTLEILFQQNIYPAEKFTVDVPESGARAFMLDMQDGKYALYDLQHNSYQPADKQDIK